MWLDYLHQDESWKTKDGDIWKLEEMETDHIRNLIAHLHRHAAAFQLAEADQMEVALESLNGEGAQLAIEQELDALVAQSPGAWIDQTMLVCRLKEILKERQQL